MLASIQAGVALRAAPECAGGGGGADVEDGDFTSTDSELRHVLRQRTRSKAGTSAGLLANERGAIAELRQRAVAGWRDMPLDGMHALALDLMATRERIASAAAATSAPLVVDSEWLPPQVAACEEFLRALQALDADCGRLLELGAQRARTDVEAL